LIILNNPNTKRLHREKQEKKEPQKNKTLVNPGMATKTLSAGLCKHDNLL